MGIRINKSALIFGLCAIGIALLPVDAPAQKSKPKMVPVPEGGCAITGAALQAGQTCAAKCSEEKWCPVQWCLQGKLETTWLSCYEPTGLCEPKC
jgi:hypothetical protein